jgi:hypothetical protein
MGIGRPKGSKSKTVPPAPHLMAMRRVVRGPARHDEGTLEGIYREMLEGGAAQKTQFMKLYHQAEADHASANEKKKGDARSVDVDLGSEKVGELIREFLQGMKAKAVLGG